MALDVDSIGFIFPGQGAQVLGMGRWLCENEPAARAVFDDASKILGYDLTDVCWSGAGEKLNATEYGQPALFVSSMAAVAVIRQRHPEWIERSTAAAGLSLGEYTAVCFAGGLDFESALRLVQRRGQAMQEAADRVKSGMASVLGLDLEKLRTLCQEVRVDDEVLQPANLLCPGNIAVSGHLSAIERLEPVAMAAGAMRVLRLSVAGAFHTSLMQPAVEALTDALQKTPLTELTMPVYSNVDATPHQDTETIRGLLSQQVVSPVMWEDSVKRMLQDGIQGFLEVGTGRVLRGTIKRIARKTPTAGFGESDS